MVSAIVDKLSNRYALVMWNQSLYLQYSTAMDHLLPLSLEWWSSIGIDLEKAGLHSLRRTKAVLIYRLTGKLHVIQLLLGHSKILSTVRYLGVGVDKVIEIAEKITSYPLTRYPQNRTRLVALSAFPIAQVPTSADGMA